MIRNLMRKEQSLQVKITTSDELATDSLALIGFCRLIVSYCSVSYLRSAFCCSLLERY